MGRHQKDIDAEGVRKLAGYGCTRKMIADYFDCSESTIDHKFANELKLGRSTLQKNILMWQVRRCAKGSDTMLVHMGKHYCGQNDKASGQEPLEESTASDDSGNPIEP